MERRADEISGINIGRNSILPEYDGENAAGKRGKSYYIGLYADKSRRKAHTAQELPHLKISSFGLYQHIDGTATVTEKENA